MKRYLDGGWEEVDVLGRGARGPVISIRRSDGTGGGAQKGVLGAV